MILFHQLNFVSNAANEGSDIDNQPMESGYVDESNRPIIAEVVGT